LAGPAFPVRSVGGRPGIGPVAGGAGRPAQRCADHCLRRDRRLRGSPCSRSPGSTGSAPSQSVTTPPRRLACPPCAWPSRRSLSWPAWPLPVPTRARCRHEQLRRGRFPAPGCLFSWLSRPSAPLGSSSGSRPTPTLRSRRLPVWSPSSSEQSSMSESASSTTSPYLRRLPRAGSGHARRLDLYRNLMRRTRTAAGPLRSRQVPYVERDWSRSRA
jgi:hypothetical protein